MEDSLLYTALLGIASALVTELSKKTGIQVRYLLVMPAIIIAAMYVIAQQYAPQEILKAWLDTLSRIIAASVIFYEFILVRVMPDSNQK